jgi:hypothetical protein
MLPNPLSEEISLSLYTWRESVVTNKNGNNIRGEFQSLNASGDSSSPVPLHIKKQRRFISGVTRSHFFRWHDIKSKGDTCSGTIKQKEKRMLR